MTILDYVLTVMSDGTRSEPVSGTVEGYTEFAKFFYRKIFEKTSTIDTNFHYEPILSYAIQQIDEGK